MIFLSEALLIVVLFCAHAMVDARYSTWPWRTSISYSSKDRNSSLLPKIAYHCDEESIINNDINHILIHNSPLSEAIGLVGLSLQTIIIHNPKYDDVNGESTILCKSLMSNSSALKLLSLHNHAHADRYPAKVFIDYLGYCKNLETLDLALMFLKPRTISAVIQALPSLISLSTIVLDSNHIPIDIVNPLVNRLKRSSSIRHVSLSGCKLTDDAMEDFAQLLKANRNITSLDMSCNEITIEGLKKLFDHIRYSFETCELQLLDLSYNNLGEEGVNYIGSLISTGCLFKIRHLVLREVGAGPLSIEKLFHAVNSKSALETVDLSGNCLLRKKAKDSSVIGDQLMNPMTKSLFSAVQSVSGTILGIQSQLTGEVMSSSSASPPSPSNTVQISTKTKKRYRTNTHNKNKKTSRTDSYDDEDSIATTTLKQPVIVDMRESERKEVAAKIELGGFLHVARAIRGAMRKAKNLRGIRLLKTGLSRTAIEQLQTILTSSGAMKDGSNAQQQRKMKLKRSRKGEVGGIEESDASGDSTSSSPQQDGTPVRSSSSGKVGGRTVVVDVALNAVDGEGLSPPQRLIEVSL